MYTVWIQKMFIHHQWQKAGQWLQGGAVGQRSMMGVLIILTWWCIDRSKLIKLYTKKFLHLWYINYSSITLLWKQLSQTMSIQNPPRPLEWKPGSLQCLPSLTYSGMLPPPNLIYYSLPWSLSSRHTECLHTTIQKHRHISTLGSFN